MPFCEDCSHYWAPSAMTPEGTCPTCGRALEAPHAASTISAANAPAKVTAKNLDLRKLAAGQDASADDTSAPWHFKLMVFLLIVYLGWRVVDLFL
jgi:hypothetical protein